MAEAAAQTGAQAGPGAGERVLLLILPLVLAQFIASYAGSNMNVAVNDIARDIGTTVHGVQTAITLFTLTMAALMIPGSKLTDIWGRKRCFVIGMLIYGTGALLASVAQRLVGLIVGYSLLQGVGSALMIPPIYILTTVAFGDVTSRAKAFGLISAAAGVGAAAGPLIGGLITTWLSWRASFLLQVAVVAGIVFLSRKISDPGVQGKKPQFDLTGAILSASSLVFIVFGVLQAGDYGWLRSTQDVEVGGTVLIEEGGVSPVWILVAIGAVLQWLFIREISGKEARGGEPLIRTRMFKNKRSNLGLVTQNIQWLILQGTFFVFSVYIQTVRGYSAVETGLILTPSTIGLLLSSAMAGRLARKRSQRTLVRAGFVVTITGTILTLVLNDATTHILYFVPGLFLMGSGIGAMLTSSVNVVQSSFPEKDQGEISGLSRSVSNLGSSIGVALVGSVLVSASSIGDQAFGYAIIAMAGIGTIGLLAAILLPPDPETPGEGEVSSRAGAAQAP